MKEIELSQNPLEAPKLLGRSLWTVSLLFTF